MGKGLIAGSIVGPRTVLILRCEAGNLLAMQPLEPPDTFYLSAAIGWMELGNPGESRLELGRIAAANQHHPDVLEVRWALHAEAKDWDSALMVAEILITHHPNEPQGWIHRAYALRRTPTGGIEKARAALLPAVQLFPEESVIPYNLSCYDAQTGRLEEAWLWLQKAMKIGGQTPMKRMALADSDLEPLWERIRKMGA